MPALLVSHGVKEYLAKDLKLKLEEVKVQKRDAVAAKKLPDVVADIKLYTNFFFHLIPKTLTYVVPHIVQNVKCFAFASLMPLRSSKYRRLLSTSEMRLANSGNSKIVFIKYFCCTMNISFMSIYNIINWIIIFSTI